MPLTEEELKKYALVFDRKTDKLWLPSEKQLYVRERSSESKLRNLNDPEHFEESEGRIRCWYNDQNKANIIATLRLNSESEPEIFGQWKGKLHISIAFPKRVPTWEEYGAVKEALFGPNMEAMQVLPRAKYYYSFHSHCLHLWEMDYEWIINQV